ncbi:MAG TPA: NmrA family NAD(P)-binding protein [Gemmatimonadota bacterium]|jgi:uncharacterized protein YbjT (DUF2867 family)
MRILVIGGTGKVGSALVDALASEDVDVRVMSRTPRAGTASVRVESVAADLNRPASLAPAFVGVDRCYLLTPLSQNEVELGVNAVEAARAAGIERLVFQSVSHAGDYPMIPHFASKVRILDRIRESGLSWAVILPASFYQNDVVLRDLILGPGIYPNPIGGGGVNRVDVRDIAVLAAKALLEPGFESREIPAVGPQEWTGDSIAAIYSEILGRKVRYMGDDLDAWAANARDFIPEWLVHDLRLMFAQFQKEGLAASADELAETRSLLGREPRGFREFAAELVTRSAN